ncbi:MAG: hypothetical protein K2L67_00670 [Clostridia bacterium]|nr:hypothetical protein [Clostridia bacterium]
MDKDGKLYYNGEPSLDKNGKQRVLYKHTAAAGMYLGDVSDREAGVVKRNSPPESIHKLLRHYGYLRARGRSC